ncbi:hypothetical protein G9A89_008777 [Geosiphon pyriformis]|nr:hypothetical protein G9A89_008777 [Geosiphon pyriformis]
MRHREFASEIFRRRSFVLTLIICLVFLLVRLSYAKSDPNNSKELIPLARQQHVKRLFNVANAFPGSKQKIRELRSTPLVLITTLDGDLHGVDRYSGQILWSLDGVAEGPLIKTSGRNSSDIQNNITNNVDENDASSKSQQEKSQKENEKENIVENSQLGKLQEEEDLGQVTYIVEPTNDGILYMFSPKTGLQKFPFSIKQLVNLSPFRSVDGKVFVGSKSTKFFAVDPRTGKMLQSFDSEGEDECPSMGKLPRDALYLGKNAYKISIFDGKSNKPMWNVTYNEFVPNSLDVDVEMNYKTSPDGLYIASTHTGEVLSTDSENGQHVWYQKFDSPAISVFDVLATSDLSNGLHIARQPRPPKEYYKRLYELQSTPLMSAYIDRIDGTLFAMSAENYPMTHFMGLSQSSQSSSSVNDDYVLNKNEHNDRSKISGDDKEFCHPGSEIYPTCLIGNHILGSTERPLIGSQSGNHSPVPQITFRYIEIAKPRTLVQAGLSWMIIFGIFGALFYYNRRQKHGGHPLVERAIAILATGFTRNKPTQYPVIFDSSGTENSKSKKKKKGSKGPTVNTKKVEVKDDEREKVASNLLKTLSPNANGVSKTVGFENTSVFTISGNPEQAINIGTPTLSPSTNGELRLNSLVVSDTILGYGSHGTIVYQGTFEGRDVAVKRLLLDFYDIAYHEVSLLQESDDHPNVIRYYCKEQCDRFLYIALELCPASLYDVIERGSSFRYAELLETLDTPKILYQIICGLHHLHSMKIVHRDIKPQNILIASSKYKRRKDGSMQPSVARVLISDFGLCKKLEGDTSSFHNTTNNAGGTIGWRAPELLSPSLSSPSDEFNTTTTPEDVWTSVDRINDNSFTSSSGSDHGNSGQPRRVTKAIDIFSTGCLFYYVLSNGDHPFGDRYSREVNILKGVYELNKLNDMGEEGVEARNLIERMIERDPKKRPRASTVMIHPYFWSPSKRLAFLQDASDRFEVEERDPPSPLLQRLERDAINIIGPDWYRRIDRILVENLGKYRKYDGSRVRDLLRALRNKKHHYQDLPEHVKKSLGEVPGGFLFYFTSRFPKLLLHVYYVIVEKESLKNESIFRHYFEIPAR